MPWVRVEDSAPEHRKHLKAGPAACWMWVCAIAYSQRQLSDGFVPAEAIASIGVRIGAKTLVDKLVSVGLFDLVEGGYQVHDYHDFNDTREEAIQRKADLREKRAAAGRNGGIKSGITRLANAEAKEANAKQTGSKPSKPNEAPSHPIPYKEQIQERASDPISARAAAFIHRYPLIYAEVRHGAHYPVREARDFETFIALVTGWPDDRRLDEMFKVFLNLKGKDVLNQPGSPGQFLHHAPECDALLRANGR